MAKMGKIPTKRRGKSVKIKTLEVLERLFSEGDGAVFFDNNGLSVAQATTLRAMLRERNCHVKVAKNTLIARALTASGKDAEDYKDLLKGPTVVAIGLEDPVSAAKGVKAFMKSLDDDAKQPITIKGGFLEGKAIDAQGVETLAAMPGREEMIAMLLGSMSAPAQNMCYALNASVSQLAWALNAHKTKLEEAA